MAVNNDLSFLESEKTQPITMILLVIPFDGLMGDFEFDTVLDIWKIIFDQAWKNDDRCSGD